MAKRKAHIILKDGSSADVEFSGNYIDCMNLCYEIYGYFPYIDSEYHIK